MTITRHIYFEAVIPVSSDGRVSVPTPTGDGVYPDRVPVFDHDRMVPITMPASAYATVPRRGVAHKRTETAAVVVYDWDQPADVILADVDHLCPDWRWHPAQQGLRLTALIIHSQPDLAQHTEHP